jgi:hypothetical protein
MNDLLQLKHLELLVMFIFVWTLRYFNIMKSKIFAPVLFKFVHSTEENTREEKIQTAPKHPL